MITQERKPPNTHTAITGIKATNERQGNGTGNVKKKNNTIEVRAISGDGMITPTVNNHPFNIIL